RNLLRFARVHLILNVKRGEPLDSSGRILSVLVKREVSEIRAGIGSPPGAGAGIGGQGPLFFVAVCVDQIGLANLKIVSAVAERCQNVEKVPDLIVVVVRLVIVICLSKKGAYAEMNAPVPVQNRRQEIRQFLRGSSFFQPPLFFRPKSR